MKSEAYWVVIPSYNEAATVREVAARARRYCPNVIVVDDGSVDGTVQALAGNRWLDRATGDLRRFVRLLRGRQLNWPGRIEASINEHRVLLDAIVQRDAARAERVMHDHLMAQLAALKALRAHERSAVS